jgi:hypothetical protein
MPRVMIRRNRIRACFLLRTGTLLKFMPILEKKNKAKKNN